MPPFLLGLLAFLGIVIFVWLFLVVNAVRGTIKTTKKLEKLVAPVAAALAAGQTPDAVLVLRLAEDAKSRKALFETLEGANRLDLFPDKFLNQEALAEGCLVHWLCHPNEMTREPDEIELAAIVPCPGEDYDKASYYVFKFRTFEPHFMADKGWMAGVSGPFEHGKLSTEMKGTFSRFDTFDSHTTEQHVRINHEARFGPPSAS